MSPSRDRLLYRDDLRFLAGIAGLCALIAIAIIGSLIMKPVRLLAGVACALSLSACASSKGITDFTTHLNERNCATQGGVTASAGLLGTQVGGHLEWDCRGDKAAAPAP